MGDEAKRAHQSVAILSSPKLGVDISFPLSVRATGKAKLSIPHKKIPTVLLTRAVAGPLTLQLAVASFDEEVVVASNESQQKTKKSKEENKEEGEETEEEEEVEETVETKSVISVSPLLITITTDVIAAPPPQANPNIQGSDYESFSKLPERYQIKPEIHHIFRTPEKRLSAAYAGAFILVIPVLTMILLNSWTLFAQVNFNQLPTALANAPIAHITFIFSLISIQLTFFRYYRSESIFNTLFALAVIVPIAVFSGSRALREVKARRLQGLI